MAKTSVSLKLLIDTQSKRVLFAEAGKDCVDFLFHILSLPVAKLISLLSSHGMVGSLPNLFESIETLDEAYLQPNQSKNTLLKPISPSAASSSSCVPLLAIDDAPATATHGNIFYRCAGGCVSYVSDDQRAICPSCNRNMTARALYVAPPPASQQVANVVEGGFVKGVVTYMVMDDLVVKPMSTISSITMLNKFNVKEVGALEEKVVDLGMDEAVKLLKAALETKNVLTRVFLNAKK